MLYFVYCTDRPGSAALRDELVEAHWAYMDGFAARLHARGPTLTDDGETATGSLHVVDLPSDAAAREFGELEPNWRAGVYAAMDVYRFEDLLGRSMWDFAGPDGPRFLVVALGDGDAGRIDRDQAGLIVLGRLRAVGTGEGEPVGVGTGEGDPVGVGTGEGDPVGVGTGDGEPVGVGACVQAPDAAAAAAMLAGFAAREVSVRPWRFGGRPASSV